MSDFLTSIQLGPDQASKLPDSSPSPERVLREMKRFVRGPIPAEWLQAAARLPGRALHAAMAICYLDGFERTGTVHLRPSVRDAYGLDRYSSARALKHLEQAGLVTVARKPGAAPTVTILKLELAARKYRDEDQAGGNVEMPS